jgi:hypothetical protein
MSGKFPAAPPSRLCAKELANTVTPLVAGFLVAKLGAAVCGLVATGLVFGS